MFQRIALILLLILTFPAMAPAADPDAAPANADERDATTDQLIDRLDDADYEHREQAAAELMRRENVDEDRLADALRRSTSPEQLHRLTRIAMHRYFHRMNPTDAPRDQGPGSIGIDIADRNILRANQYPQLDRTAVLISGTKPGFPGYVFLRPGDLILAMDGQPFDDNLDRSSFVTQIQRYQAGETMDMDVLRDGRRIRVSIELDSHARLQQIYANPQMSQAANYPPWGQHLRELLGDAAPAPTFRIEPPTSGADE